MLSRRGIRSDVLGLPNGGSLGRASEMVAAAVGPRAGDFVPGEPRPRTLASTLAAGGRLRLRLLASGAGATPPSGVTLAVSDSYGVNVPAGSWVPVAVSVVNHRAYGPAGPGRRERPGGPGEQRARAVRPAAMGFICGAVVRPVRPGIPRAPGYPRSRTGSRCRWRPGYPSNLSPMCWQNLPTGTCRLSIRGRSPGRCWPGPARRCRSLTEHPSRPC